MIQNIYTKTHIYTVKFCVLGNTPSEQNFFLKLKVLFRQTKKNSFQKLSTDDAASSKLQKKQLQVIYFVQSSD